MHNFESPAHTHLVIYHANCTDGFAAAWVARRFLPIATRFEPCSYGEFPKPALYQDKIVYIVDFSFPREVLTNMAAIATKIVVIDHHKTAQEALEDWEDRSENIKIYFDLSKSGAGRTWDYFNQPNTPRPAFIDYIEDRDLWKFKLPYSKEINAYISFVNKTFISYDILCGLATSKMIDKGELLLAQHQKICEEIALAAVFVTINKIPGLACNCTPQFSSEVGHILAQKSETFGATYHYIKNGSVKWSLRSIGDYDVSAIAKEFGGGGHKNAAGFTLGSDGADRSDHTRLWTVGAQS